jgi:hypothetical protein
MVLRERERSNKDAKNTSAFLYARLMHVAVRGRWPGGAVSTVAEPCCVICHARLCQPVDCDSDASNASYHPSDTLLLLVCLHETEAGPAKPCTGESGEVARVTRVSILAIHRRGVLRERKDLDMTFAY